MVAEKKSIHPPIGQEGENTSEDDSLHVDQAHRALMPGDIPLTDCRNPFPQPKESQHRQNMDQGKRAKLAHFVDEQGRPRQHDHGQHPKPAGNTVNDVALPSPDGDGAKDQGRQRRGNMNLDDQGGFNQDIGVHQRDTPESCKRTGQGAVFSELAFSAIALIEARFPLHPSFANDRPAFVSEPNLQSTLRDLRTHLLQPQVATTMAGIALILGLSGPFDTWTTLPLPVRLLYWASVVWLTYSTGSLVTLLLKPHLRTAGQAVRTIAVAVSVAIAVFVVLAALNSAFGQGPESPWSALSSFGAVLVICLVIEVTRQVLDGSDSAATSDLPPAERAPALLLRLPLHKRGELLSLSAQDHYVDVVTSKGHEMLLMRLGDAMRETAPVAGLQVHRSHWVALSAVAAAEKRGDGAILTLKNSKTIPVSRAFMTALRDANLLPGKVS